MRDRKHIIQISIVCLLTGCASSNVKLLGSLVYSDGCTSACWVGIEVGKTSFEQAQEILDERYTSRNTDLLPFVNIMLWRTNEVDSSYGTIGFSQGIVDGVQLFFEEKKFIADDAITVLGEPSEVMILIETNESQRQCAGIQLSYSDTGVMAYLDVTQVFKGVEKSQSVTGFRFMSPKDLEDLQLGVQHDGIATVVDWQGYKDYCEIISLPPKIP